MSGPALLAGLAVLLWAVPRRPWLPRHRRVDTVAAGSAGPRRRPRPGRSDHTGWVADLAEVVTVGLEAGLDLPHALLAAVESPGVRDEAPWLRHRVRAAVVAGASVAEAFDAPPPEPDDVGRLGTVLGRGRRAPPASDLAALGRAWRLAEVAGASASATTAAVAASLRDRDADRRRTSALVAGPRTSMWLLTALPVAGPVVGVLVGFGPERLYASGPAQASAVAGVLLTVAGWVWARRLVGSASRVGTTSGDPG